MRRRRQLVYICIIFLTFETILLLEQQKTITRDKNTRNTHSHDIDPEESLRSGSNLSSKVNRPDDFIVHSSPGKETSSLKSEQLVDTGIPNGRRIQYTLPIYNDSHLNSSRNPSPSTVDIKPIFHKVKETSMDSKLHGSSQKTKAKTKFPFEMRNQQRLERIEKVCEAPVVGEVARVLVNPSNTVSYCVTHKIASTHWLRVFRFLWNATSANVSSPSKISKLEAHLSHSKLPEHSMDNIVDQQLIFDTSRFMFVREPFNRLWSVYIDKFILADNYFWSFYGPKVARANGMVVLPSLKPCYQFTFKHFIKFVIESAESPEDMDDHIKPVHMLCNPCVFQPNFLGKLETMASDGKTVHEVLDVQWGEEGTDPTYEEIRTIVDFNFHIVGSLRLLTRCLTPVLLGRRILRAFVLNGYIPEDAESAIIKQLPLGKQRFLDIVWNMYVSTKRTRHMMKEQRLKFKQNAFLTIPLEDMHKLQEIYDKDFELFDYRLDPPELFYNKRTS